MHQPVTQPGDHIPGLLRIRGLELRTELVDLFPDVIERGRDGPLGKFVLEQKLRRDAAFVHLKFQTFPCGNDFFQAFLVRFLHAILTPSRMMLS